jgi:hypothetical protein
LKSKELYIIITKMNSTKTKGRGRPKHGRSLEENKEWIKGRSKLYYSDPVNKEAQKLKMRTRGMKNRNAINEKKNQKARLKTLDRRLRKIWLLRGLVVGK